MPNIIRIHSFPLSGHAHRVELFCAVANIAYEVVNVDLPAGEHKQTEFLALNPFGQVPVIEDGDVVLADSNAILVYLAKKYASAFMPAELHLEAEVQKFLTLAAGEIIFGPAAARLITVFNASINANFAKATAEKVLTKLEMHMQGRDFLVDDKPTIADIAIYSYVAHAPEGNVSLEPYPNVRRLLMSIEALDGFVPMQATKVGLMA